MPSAAMMLQRAHGPERLAVAGAEQLGRISFLNARNRIQSRERDFEGVHTGPGTAIRSS